MILYGQGWCYDGGDGYYRLGYVDRDHGSDPRLSGRVYATYGEVPARPGLCEDEIVALQAHYSCSTRSKAGRKGPAAPATSEVRSTGAVVEGGAGRPGWVWRSEHGPATDEAVQIGLVSQG